MPNNIGYSSSPGYSSGAGAPAVQDWYINPERLLVVSSVNDANPLARQTIGGYFKDYTQSSFASSHDSFVARAIVLQDVRSPQLILPIVGSAASGLDRDLNDPDSLFFFELLDLRFVELLPAGSYIGGYRYEIYANNLVTQQEELIDSRTVEIELQRVGDFVNVLNPSRVNLAYLRGVGDLGGQTIRVIAARTFNEAVWLVRPVGIFNVSITNSTVLNDGSIGTNFDQDLTVATTSSWETVAAGVHFRVLNISFVTADEYRGLGVNVHVFDTPGIMVSRKRMEFTSIVPDTAAAQTVDIVATGAFTIVAPPWLQVSDTDGNISLVLSARPIDVSNFSGGSFQEDIIITMGNIERRIVVVLTVLDRLDSSVETDGINFTGDLGAFKVSGFDTDHYLAVRLAGTVYDQENTSGDVSHSATIPFVGSSAIYRPGRVIDTLVPGYFSLAGNVLEDPSSGNEVQQYPNVATFSFYLRVVHRASGSTVFERNIANTRWLRGIMPYRKLGVPAAPLALNQNVSRLDASGRFLFNTYSNAGGVVSIYLNGGFQRDIPITGGSSPSSRILVLGSDYLEGDRVELRQEVQRNGQVVAVSDFVVIYPQQERSCHVVYTTMFNTIEVMQLCGEIKGAIGYDRRTDLLLSNEVEISRHVDITHQTELVLNTGFIPRDQIPQVHRINKSLRAWLIYGDLDPIEISVQTADMVSYDSELFKYEYDIKCVTNSDNHAQIHTF